MVAVLIRLKLNVLRRTLGRESSRLISYIIGGIFAGFVAIASIPAAIALRSASVDSASISLLALATMTVMWMLAPLLTVGVDATLDPQRLSLFPLRARQLLPGLLAAALVGIPGAVTIVFALAHLVIWSRSIPALLAALFGAVLGVVTGVVLSRAISSMLARSLWKRRSRFLVMLLFPLLYLMPALFNLLLLSGGGGALGSSGLRQASRVAAWSPFGWAWAMPWQVARGAWGLALLDLLLAVCFLGALLLLWARVLSVELTSTAPQESARVRDLRSAAWGSRVRSSNPLAAVTRRRMLAWRRDTRLTAQAVSMTTVSLLPLVPALFDRTGDFPSIPAPTLLIVAAGVLTANDLAYDGSSWWMQVVAGVPGWIDRAGRVLAIGIPVLVVAVLVSVLQAALGQPVAWLLVSGPLASALLVALGVGCALGALDPGQAPRRGSNPFAGNAGNGARGCLTAASTFVAPALLSAPIIIGAVLARGSDTGQFAVLLAGILWGGGVLTLAVWWGGQHLDHRAPEMLDKLRVFG